MFVSLFIYLFLDFCNFLLELIDLFQHEICWDYEFLGEENIRDNFIYFRKYLLTFIELLILDKDFAFYSRGNW